MEYEWEPPICATCCVFVHASADCPKLAKEKKSSKGKVDGDGFTEVRSKKAKFAGVVVHKSKPKFEYRPVFNGNGKEDGRRKTMNSNEKYARQTIGEAINIEETKGGVGLMWPTSLLTCLMT